MANRVNPRTNVRNPPTVDVIERSRSYRTPVKATPNSYQAIVPAKRPIPGVRGVPFELKVNWFRIKFTSREMYIYEAIVEKRKSKFARNYDRIKDPITISTIMYSTIHQYREVFINPWRVFFDDFEYIFTPDRLKMHNKEELTLVAADGTFRVRIFEHQRFSLNLSSGVENTDNVQWSSIFIKLLLSQNARFIPSELGAEHDQSIHARFAHYGGGMYFIPRSVKKTSAKRIVQPGVEAWLGFYLACRYLEDGDPVINYGMTNKFFVSLNLKLLDFYLAIINDGLGKTIQPKVLTKESVMLPQGVEDFTERLSGLKVKSEWVPGKDKTGMVVDKVERHYRFIRAMQPNECADNYFLIVFDPKKKLKRRLRMDEWYAEQGMILEHPKLPLCEVKTGKRTDLIPMELLFTHDRPQKFTKLLDRNARMRIPSLLARSPEQHYRLTTDMVGKKMEYSTDPFMKAMQIMLEKEMIDVDGRVLRKSPIITKDESGQKAEKIDMNPETGEYALRRAYDATDKQIVFVVCRATDRIKQEDVMSFYRGLVEKCKSRGMQVSKKEVFRQLEKQSISAITEDVLQFVEKGFSKENEVLVFLYFIGNMDEELYGEIKLLSDLNYGVVTQAITESTVTKMLPSETGDTSDYKSVFHNIWLKLNVKLGGVNQIVDFSDSDESESESKLPTHEKTMFIGIDVIHPSPNSPVRTFSLAAIVASTDRNATKYTDRIMVNRNCNETVQHFEDHFAGLLLAYHTERGHLPDRIVILRDGVSDTEMILAASRELQSIKAAWKRCANGKPLPQFTYIVAQKRHRTRFYRRDISEKNNANPFPGTVVTSGAVSPHKFDFYMISHYTQSGTTRPIHYTVVVDESEFSTDEITEMCFRLCCLYARCSKPVSIPTPIYYAHLRCKRAAIQFQYAVKSEQLGEIEDVRRGESERQYEERVEMEAMKIEKFLNRDFNEPKKYPGMAFV